MRASLGSRGGDNPSMVPQVEQLGYAFLAPSALTALISAIELGIIIVCFTRFLVRLDKERWGIKALVYFVTCVAVCVVHFFTTWLYYTCFLAHLLNFFFLSPMNCKTGFKRERRSPCTGSFSCSILAIGCVHGLFVG
jgi:hypothetical protein